MDNLLEQALKLAQEVEEKLLELQGVVNELEEELDSIDDDDDRDNAKDWMLDIQRDMTVLIDTRDTLLREIEAIQEIVGRG